MRLIDADKLMEDFPIRIHRYDKEHGNLHFVLGVESVMEYINDNMPTIEPVKRGKWVKGEHDWSVRHCSVCAGYVHPVLDISRFRYCPHCGAKMEVEE